mmetsp:Transcript_34092/g.58589  ORF Transcript_34092/g.58589 Transcript_34092/m.58589 type:complete len:105 (-) Transcript_34092:1736-2050(-)
MVMFITVARIARVTKTSTPTQLLCVSLRKTFSGGSSGAQMLCLCDGPGNMNPGISLRIILLIFFLRKWLVFLPVQRKSSCRNSLTSNLKISEQKLRILTFAAFV